MADIGQGLPVGLSQQIVDQRGALQPAWYRFFLTLYQRTGGATASISGQLDTLSSSKGAIAYRGTTQWAGLAIGGSGQVLQVVGGVPQWGASNPANFGVQAANSFLAAPSTGGGNPSFRSIVSADLDGIEGQYPATATNDNASAGNVGEFLSKSIAAGAAVALTTGTAADVGSLALTPGDWDIWGSIATAPQAATTQSQVNAWINGVSATDPSAPNGGCYAISSAPIPAGLPQALPLGMMRVSIASNTTFYLSTTAVFASGTLSAYGFIGARRRR